MLADYDLEALKMICLSLARSISLFVEFFVDLFPVIEAKPETLLDQRVSGIRSRIFVGVIGCTEHGKDRG